MIKGDHEEQFKDVSRISKLVKETAKDLDRRQARYLVASYYQMQNNRKRSASQIRELKERGLSSKIVDWSYDQSKIHENGIKASMDTYSMSSKIGQWSRSICGIGPVIAAGLIANIDMEIAKTVGHIWRFAGIDPTIFWLPKTERPWSAKLKTLCWKVGESFVKFQNNEKDFYGKIYVEKKKIELERNERGDFTAQAEEKLKKFNINKDTDAYKCYIVGKLPPAHIHERAKRYAVKMFLSHWHYVAYKLHYKEEPPKPFVIAILGHAHWIEPPNLDVVGLSFKNS